MPMVRPALKVPTSKIVPQVRKAMQPKGSDSRRGFLGGLTAGLFAPKGAAQMAPRAGASRDFTPSGDGSSALNSASEYPRPSFPQDGWPGFASGIAARPDCGETSYRGSGRLIGRKALITGGDSGMGRAAAIAFAREGADVAFNYPPTEQFDANEVVQLIREAGRKAVPLPGDLRDERFCNQLVAHAVRELGGLDVLVSNAVKQNPVADIAEMSTDQFDATFKTNIYAMFWLTKAALPHMGAGASIINTSSVYAGDPSEILLDYSATKGTIMVFTKSLAKQLASRGIRVNAVAPAPIWTPLQSSDAQVSDQRPEFGTDPARARPEPADLASIYVLLASDESIYSTGQLYGAVG
jgi:NAD(P)-dependent dehydrogenase (short-subunit alcohol dehydrogenase family)